LNTPLRVLVATDGSEASQGAVRWSAAFARGTGAEVIVAHVLSTVIEWFLSVAQIDFLAVEKEHRALLAGAWTEPLREAGVAYRTEFRTGATTPALLGLADEEDVDLIVIGRTGRTSPGEFLLGGSATKLAHHTTRPLILVPEQAAP
jgi:nucleotide-binding universal stress UspA family protein